MKGKEKMKSLVAEDMLIRNDLKYYIDKSKVNLKRKLIIGNKYAIKTKEPNKMSIYTNDNKFLGFIGINNCMLLFETKVGYNITLSIKDICLNVSCIKNENGEIIK